MALLVHGSKRARSADEHTSLTEDAYASRDDFPARKRREMEPDKPNHILLMTIVNPLYPVTVETICAIVAAHGQVLRIVIFRKNGVQALVELDSIASAVRVKLALGGLDIYSGCCTLRIEFAKPARLNVYKNDADSWDFTNPTLTPGVMSAADFLPKSGILPEPCNAFPGFPYAFGLDPLRGASIYGPGSIADSLVSPFGLPSPAAAAAAVAAAAASSLPPELAGPPPRPPGPLPCDLGPPGMMTAASMSPGMSQQGGVLMVYGLSRQMINADRLFNIFCLYGNVARVKYLKTKEGCAMVQMGDPIAVERAISNLNNVQLFGTKIQLGYSKQAFLNNVQQPYTLPDCTLSYKDYTGCKNNRFLNPNNNNKNRIQAPSKVLHFFNTPPHMGTEDMTEIFHTSGVCNFLSINIFPSKTERSSSGLLEFGSIDDALEALVLCNHKPIAHPSSKFPFIMKLCFSSSKPSADNGEQKMSAVCV